MDLKTYCSQLSYPERVAFAEKAGTKWVYLSQIIREVRDASPFLARRLAAASDGNVSLSEIRPDIFGPNDAAVA